MTTVYDPEACRYHLRVTLFGEQVLFATDSERIQSIMADSFGSRYFAPNESPPEKTFYCSVTSSPWDAVMAFPDQTYLSRAHQDSGCVFDLFRCAGDRIEPAGFYSYEKSPDLSEVPTAMEIFAAEFQTKAFEEILKRKPSLRLIHGGAVAYGGAGLLLLGPTRGGKSTLTLACVLAGMHFLSDDHLPFDLATKTMQPFPRMLRLRSGTCEMVPDFARLCSKREVDPVGELRSFLHPETIRPDALGQSVRLTHVVNLAGFAERPLIKPATRSETAMNCTVADFFAKTAQTLDLVWQWSSVMDEVKCAQLHVGAPLATAEALRDFLES